MRKWTKKQIKKGWNKLKPQKHHSKFQKVLRSAISLFIIGGLALATFLFLWAFVLIIFVLPNPNDLRDLNLTESTLIMDREGGLLYAIHGEENRESLDSLVDISPSLVDATLAIEDDQFYQHWGVDVPALFKAVLSEFGIGTPRGGSTVTQQFVKNTFLSSDRTFTRKFKEIILALGLELRFSKDEILLMYLNAIPYGSNAYGIELAADRYFNKDAADLSLAESAVLASIPKAPTRYSPYGNYRYTTLHFELSEEALGDRKISGEGDLAYDEWTRGLIGKEFEMPDGSSFYLKGRSDLVLDRMLSLDLITKNEYDETIEEIQNIEFPPYRETIEAPHFVLWVKQQLEEKYGAAVVEQGGLKVYTTLDPEFQEAAEIAIADRKEFNTDNYDAGNAALVSVHPQTGQILAMVGSADYFDDEIDGQVNIITSSRQPGSSFKPFVYALSFLNQYSPATVLYDVPTDFGSGYKPNNYDGSFMGPMSIREALAKSRNIPAIKAYFMAGQEEDIIPFAKSFGLNSINDSGNYGPPLALGVAEVTPLELAEAYTVFANGGYKVEPTAILKIENAEGDVLEQWEEIDVKKEEVLDPQVAFLISDILSDASVGLGANSRVESLDNAAKTGTSNKKLPSGNILPNNGWLAAFTPDLVTITWAGNADGEPMSATATGYTTAAPIWKSYITSILPRLETAAWPRPDKIKEVAISRASGLLPSDSTPSDMIATEVFADFAVPTADDNSYETVRIETISNRRATKWSPELFVEEKDFRIHRSPLAGTWPNWQDAINAWAKENDQEQPPTETANDIHNAAHAENNPEIVITSPKSLSAVSPDDRTVDIEVDISDVGNGVQEVRFNMNGHQQYIAVDAPYEGRIRLPFRPQDGDIIEVSATVVDIYGYNSTSEIQLRVSSSSRSNNSGNDDESGN